MKTFPCGIHLDSKKEMTKDIAISIMPVPKKVYIPLVQHIGAPAKSTVAVGDIVKRGQRIGDATGVISAHVFSPCSGKVIDIQQRATPLGKCEHIIIENDGNDSFEAFPPIDNPDREQIIKRIENCGITGMGGAGFPTKVKVSPKEKIEHFIINAAECEPYITCDYRILLDYTDKFLDGALLLAKALGLDKAYIGIEDNKLAAVDALNSMIAKKNLNAEVIVCKTKYPQGAEKQLIFAITGKKVPAGKLPSAVGVVVSNVHTALATFFAVRHGTPLYERVITVTGEGIKTPKNLVVASGTLYSDVIEYCGGLSDVPTVKLVSGGPMMGVAVSGDAFSCTKTTSSLLLMTGGEAFTGKPNPCINCGKCSRSCPMKLMPMFIDAYSLVNDIDNAVKYGALDCIECGCCAYVCPAKRPLTQSIRLAKNKYKSKEKV